MQNKVKFVLYGTHTRDCYIEKIKVQLASEDLTILYNSGHSGEVLDLCIEAWQCGLDSDYDYICVLQDDLELCTNFIEMLDLILTSMSNYRDQYILTLFNFKRRDVGYTYLSTNESPYLRTSMVSGCINVMSRRVAQGALSYLKQISDINASDDTSLTRYAESKQLYIISTKNSLVQHLGDISTIDSTRPQRISNNYRQYSVDNYANFNWATLGVTAPSLKAKLLYDWAQ